MQLSDDDKQLLMMFADGESLSASDAAHASTLEASAEGRAWMAAVAKSGDLIRARFAAPNVSEDRQTAVLAKVQTARPAELKLIGAQQKNTSRRAVALGMSFAVAAGFVGWTTLRSNPDENLNAALVPSRGCAPSVLGDAGTHVGSAECVPSSK